MHFGELVRHLRKQRRMTQTELAALAGIAVATVNRIEQATEPPFRSTATALLGALERGGRSPLQEVERTEYLRLAKMEHLLNGLQPTFDTIPLRAFTAGLSPDAARVYWAVADLLDRVGPASLLQMLQAAASLAGVALEPPVPGDSGGSSVRVVKPPVQRDGYVEQEIVEYGPADAPPAEKEEPASPKKKRRSS